jgi:hypothetical protein
MVGEEIARDRDSVHLGAVTPSKKGYEQPKQLRIGVRNADAVSMLVRLCPEEHAPGEMEAIAVASTLSALQLSVSPTRSPKSCVRCRPGELTWRRGASAVELPRSVPR